MISMQKNKEQCNNKTAKEIKYTLGLNSEVNMHWHKNKNVTANI